MWDKRSIKGILKDMIGDALFVVVSNREPYIHKWREGKIVIDKPASGLVTALDPIMQACHGTWVAHGSGNADRKVVDSKNRLRVPPGKGAYTLRRVWLTKEEERGYYFGLANSVLWPLCHIAFTPPSFDERDWETYKRVNQNFADTVIDEVGDRKALVWVQDFHFALLPSMLKKRRPNIMVAQFWHIPWPNPEVFRICPWVREILEGMLGSDLIGFHIGMHCENFLDMVDQTMEVRIDWERSIVYHHGGIGTKVLPFPISVDFDLINKDADRDFSENKIVQDALHALPMKHKYVGLGIDRIDYTKGIRERLKAIDRLLEKYPKLIGQFVFLQMGALSRIHIKLYKDLNDEINKLVEDINWRYATDSWQPVVMLRRNLTYPEILVLYKMADICIVSSLHDGMNLVAKEFVASRRDEDGVLLLSRFTGAARELDAGAIIINPYDTERFADAIYSAIAMPRRDRRRRMKLMRQVVSENNIYNWAGKFISELARLA